VEVAAVTLQQEFDFLVVLDFAVWTDIMIF
jgi:hypothetical protein